MHQYQINSELRFGDKFYEYKIFRQDLEGGEIIFDPVVYERYVTKITLLPNGQASYSKAPHFFSLEEAKKFCEELYYDECDKVCHIDNCEFDWIEDSVQDFIKDDKGGGKEVQIRTWNLINMVSHVDLTENNN